MRYNELDSHYKELARKLEYNYVNLVLEEMNAQESEETINEMVNERLNVESYNIEKDEFGKMKLVREHEEVKL